MEREGEGAGSSVQCQDNWTPPPPNAPTADPSLPPPVAPWRGCRRDRRVRVADTLDTRG
ncbi:hypothetical protein NHX12_010493, partial [Muraenolepis orangiensis]